VRDVERRILPFSLYKTKKYEKLINKKFNQQVGQDLTYNRKDKDARYYFYFNLPRSSAIIDWQITM
jgi:hypothetical protein